MEEEEKSLGENVKFQHDYKNEDDYVYTNIRNEYGNREFTENA